MKKWIKIIVSFFGIVILLAILAFTLLITLVNPNRFKPFIADQVQKYTGRQLTIEGDLSWSIYPYLGIKLGHTELRNPSGFQQKIFAELESATVAVKLLPLFSAKIESSGMTLNGLKLNLIRDVNGVANWQNLFLSQTNASGKIQRPTTGNSSKAAMAIVITGIDLSHATINWIDEQTKQRLTIEQLDFKAKDITSNHPFPVNAKFYFKGKNPDVAGKFNFSTTASFYFEKQLLQLKGMNLFAQIQQGGKKYEINTTTSLAIDIANQRAESSSWKGRFADIDWTGKFEIKNLKTQPMVTGYIKTQSFALHEVLVLLGQNSNDVPKASNVKADLNFTFNTAKKSVTALQKIIVQGLVKADNLEMQKIKMTNLVARMQLENGIFNLSSLTAILYQGNLQSNIKVNLNTEQPNIAVNAKLFNIQAEPLLSDLAGDSQLKFSGVGNADLQVTTIGTDKNNIIRNLNGSAKVNINNGILKGMDIPYLANAAFAIAKGRSPSLSNTGETKFGNLTTISIIRNGVISDGDLLLNMPGYITKGKGTIDLVRQQIDYSLKTKAKHDPEISKNDLLDLYGLTIPIKIFGNLSHPKIGLDTADLAKQIAEMQLKRGKEKLKGQIDKNISGVGGQLLKNILGD